MNTKVFIADVSVFNDDALFDSFYERMPVDRKKKIDEKKFAKDKFLSLGVGALLWMATQNLFHTEARDQLPTEEQKYFQTEARADYDTGKIGTWNFNLSHSGTMAMCIVSDHECGCDVELKRQGTLGIADRFFYGEEKELIALQDSEEKKTDMFFRLWTLKESFMKATRLGFRLALDEFSVVPVAENFPRENFPPNSTPPIDSPKKLSQHVNDSSYKFFEYEVSEYGCSICLKDYDGEKPELSFIDIREIASNEESRKS